LHGINEIGKRLSGGKQNGNEQKRVDHEDENESEYRPSKTVASRDNPGYNGSSPRSVDVQSFDIAGLKLGMDHEQAIAIAAGYFKVSPKALTISYWDKKDIEPPFKSVKTPIPRGNPNSRSDHLLYAEGMALTGGDEVKSKIPSAISYQKDGVKLSVSFARRIHIDKNHPVAVKNIKYSIPRSEQNFEEMFKSALAKYGPPSAGDAASTRPLGHRRISWCERPMKGPDGTCFLFNGERRTTKGNRVDNAKTLTLQATTLELIDLSLETGFAEFRASFTHPATKPNF
jgi:hypothetical protein